MFSPRLESPETARDGAQVGTDNPNFRPLLSIRVAMHPHPSPHPNDDRVLDELRLLREQLAALTSELRHRKLRAAKRVRSRRERIAREPDLLYRPTELDIARARRALR
jgi:hypothetical protein